MDRIVLHGDVDYCYAQIELRQHPEYKGHPLAVGGSREDRHGIILAKCPLAKKAGVKTGHALWQAKELCPSLQIISPNMNLYVETTDRIREIYSDYTDKVEGFGIDESFIDLTGCTKDGKSAASDMQKRIKSETGLTVSFGVAWNKTIAKLGSDLYKPNGLAVITRDNFRNIVWPLPAEDLLMVGRATKYKLNNMGIWTIGDIAACDPERLKRRFGKHGLVLSTYANGLENSPVSRENTLPAEKSIGNSWTVPRDLENDNDVWITLLGLCEGVGMRLRKGGWLSSLIEFSYRTTNLQWFSHQRKLSVATDITNEILDVAFSLYKEAKILPLRSIGVRAAALMPCNTPQQLDLFDNYIARDKMRSLDSAIDTIRDRFGYDSIQRGTRYIDKDLGKLNALKHTVHPVGFQG